MSACEICILQLLLWLVTTVTAAVVTVVVSLWNPATLVQLDCKLRLTQELPEVLDPTEHFGHKTLLLATSPFGICQLRKI